TYTLTVLSHAMSTPAYVDSETITQADGAQSSRVPVPLPDDPYVAELKSLGSRVPLIGEEFEAFEPTNTRTDSSHSTASSDSTAPLSPDYPLTHVSPTLTPTRVSFHCRTACMVMHTQSTLSMGMSVCIADAAALSPSFFQEDTKEDEEDESSNVDDERESQGLNDEGRGLDDEGHDLGDEDHGLDDESQGLEDKGLGLEEEEVVPEGQQQAVPVVETAMSEPLELGYRGLRRRGLAVGEDQVPSIFKVGQSSRSVPEQQGAERISTFRQPTLGTWVDPKDGRVYTDILAYVPLAAPVQTLPSAEWSFGSLPVSPASLIVPSPIASLVATLTATILVDEDQFIEVGAQLELHGSILHDQPQRLDALPPTLVADIDRDVRELYTRSEARPVMALKAWAGRVDTRLADMSRDRYDDHRMIHDMLVQQAVMQRKLQEMRGRVTALEQ
ncbi:hypothetical protein Tco_0475790, partial [Tanacetum coccineum]